MSLPWVSARFAAWADAFFAGEVSPDDVVDQIAVGRSHQVAGLIAGPPGSDASPVGLSLALATLRAGGARSAHLVWPVAGDVAGLPGPAPTNAAALAAGQAVVVESAEDGVGLVLVPARLDSGDPAAGPLVWSSLPALQPQLARTQLDEADRALRTAVRESADALSSLDVAHLPSDAAAAVAAARDRAAPLVLPPGAPVEAAGVLDTAQRLSSLLEIALDGQGAAITAAEMGERAAALRHVQRSARHAFCAAVNALAESRLWAR